VLRPHRENDGQQSSALRDHPVNVLVEHSACKRRNAIERSERSRPIGNGKSGVVTGNERAKDNEAENPASGKHSEAVMPRVIRCRGRRM